MKLNLLALEVRINPLHRKHLGAPGNTGGGIGGKDVTASTRDPAVDPAWGGGPVALKTDPNDRQI